MAIWSNKFHDAMSNQAYNFNQSIHIDDRLLDADLRGSMAHAEMLGRQQIILQEEAEDLLQELRKMRKEYAEGQLAIDYDEEDIHSFIEAELTRRLGSTGKKIHTGRSRNDQVATALKIYCMDEIDILSEKLSDAILAFCDKANHHLETIMPGYTHLQRAQPITYAHYLMAYVEMLFRDYDRLQDVKKRISAGMPLGAGALATSTFPLDRDFTAFSLGFTDYADNSLDAVSDRDYSIELLSALSIMSMHLSRYAEETIIWTSQEFNFISLKDTFSTGSSIMPQKKNADIHELMRGKTGRVFGDLMAVLTIMKGIPLAYNKDIQEEKERLFDGIDTMKAMISLIPAMLAETVVNEDVMYAAAGQGFINATDCADYLAAKGVPFRDAYQQTGDIIQYCIENDETLESLSVAEYKQFNRQFEEDIYDAIDLKNCTFRRNVPGGPAPERVKDHIKAVTSYFGLDLSQQ
ncbi:argininosuccinate lyase [Aerococcus urinaehominis]|uniref:Argininosuccinate lyase n=1 Tax=Aerococcus urinaehominis TaxID=128944 RepID=A0A0X8FLA5_9LACT|nr:argininosuccinate lyase [Aerococcus urinaehominis]AMB99407.1 argininosuccinate lyase [Aerococcus urinaehominis]SDM24185.1 argininosuccinate lyase [Aerococcus urinaehominis]